MVPSMIFALPTLISSCCFQIDVPFQYAWLSEMGIEAAREAIQSGHKGTEYMQSACDMIETKF